KHRLTIGAAEIHVGQLDPHRIVHLDGILRAHIAIIDFVAEDRETLDIPVRGVPDPDFAAIAFHFADRDAEVGQVALIAGLVLAENEGAARTFATHLPDFHALALQYNCRAHVNKVHRIECNFLPIGSYANVTRARPTGAIKLTLPDIGLPSLIQMNMATSAKEIAIADDDAAVRHIDTTAMARECKVLKYVLKPPGSIAVIGALEAIVIGGAKNRR